METTQEEFGYYSKIVADRIKIGKDTLRTWSLKLEAEGVEFERNERKQRIYYEKDITALQNMKELLELGHPLNDVSKIIAEKIEKGAYDAPDKEKNAENTLSVLHTKNELETQEERLNELKELMIQDLQKSQQEQLDRFKNELASEMVDAMQDRFEETVNNAVKMALLTERKKIAEEVAKEVAATQEKEKKSFWQRLFK